MMNQPSVSPQAKGSLFRAIIQAGLIAGTCDITAACLSAYLRRGISPQSILKFIAMAAFGPDALSGGVSMEITGLVFHYIIAMSWTILFFLIYPKLKFLSYSIVASGLLYGAVIWFCMNLIVLPLTLLPKSSINLTQAIIGMAILMVAVGLPVSFFANKFYIKK